MTTFDVTAGVTGIDVGMFDDGVLSVYLFADDEPTLVDAGTANGADRIAAGIERAGLSPSDLSHIVLSHVHVDHSGAAAALVEAAPDANVYIHEATAPHLADPEGLVASSRDAMGEHFEQVGAQGPVPEANLVPVSEDGTTIDIGENTLEMIHAPGHSPDHFAVWNQERGLLFASECLGSYFPRADQWLPPATLPNFDRELVADAIDRLEALDPDRIVFPHFGVWPEDTRAAFETARAQLHRFDEAVLEFYGETGSVEDTIARVADELIDLSPPYDAQARGFFSRLLTTGYLRYHGHY